MGHLTTVEAIMNIVAVRQVIEDRFVTGWSYSDIAFENVQFKPQDETYWVRLAVQMLSNEYNGLMECRELLGMVSVQIYSPLRNGTKTQEEFTDSVIQIFTGSHDGIAYQDATMVSVGESLTDAGKGMGWYQHNVLVGFTAKG